MASGIQCALSPLSSAAILRFIPFLCVQTPTLSWSHVITSRDILTRRMEELERIAHEMAGAEFELTAPADVSDVLFKVLALPPPPCAVIRGSRHLSTKVGADIA